MIDTVDGLLCLSRLEKLPNILLIKWTMNELLLLNGLLLYDCINYVNN